jgi:alpha-mannosidase
MQFPAKKTLTIFFITILIFCNTFRSEGQKTVNENVTFINAPVLFKEGGKSFQQLLANYRAQSSGKIIFMKDGKEILNAALKRGDNRFLLTVPAVTVATKISISAKINENPAVKYSVTVVPPKKWTIYFVQHSHTDIGYTRPQSEILAEHMRYIDYALDYCDQTDNLPDDARFRWTCESAWVTREYLRSRPASQIERFRKRIAEGRIEVTGMYANMAETSDENLMYDFLQPLREFSSLNIPVKTAMQNDVNGIAWCMPDYFKNTGVRYLIMGINGAWEQVYYRPEDLGKYILPFDKPTCFWWEAPSGERLLAFQADHYMTGNFFGIETKEFKPENMLWHLADLDNRGYPFDRIGIQYSGYRTDNAPPSTAASEHVKQWNAKYEYPKLRLAVAGEFPAYIEQNYSEKLPVYRKAWLDWWTDGAGSTSRETAEVRKTQNLKQADEGLFAMVSIMGGELSPSLETDLDHISENAIFFDEHTFGAAESVRLPFSENTARQWLQKGAYAWEALKKVTLLNEEALARFQPFLKKADFPVIYVINSMGWSRSGTVELFIDNEVIPPENKVKIVDISTGLEVPAQVLTKRREGAYWALGVSDIPAMGYKAFKVEVMAQAATAEAGKNVEVLENKFYKIVINSNTGSISSLFDKELDQELVAGADPYNLGQLVRETTDARNASPLKTGFNLTHTTVSNVIVKAGTNGDLWESIRIASDLSGCKKGTEGSPEGVETEVRLYKNSKKIEFKFMARKEIITDPEALYVVFPFSLPGSRILFETIGGTLTQGQQLPRSSTDWNAAQNFVAVRGKKGQVIVVSNEVPMWQFSSFNMGRFERIPERGKTWLCSWVMNNYWNTNFRAYQEGGFSWSYQITSTADTTNTFATKFAWSQRNPFPTRTFPAGANEMKSPLLETLKISGSENAMLVNSRPAFHNGHAILLHFREVEGKPAEIRLSSAIPGQTIKRMVEVTTAGKRIGEPLSTISLKPFGVRFIELEFY